MRDYGILFAEQIQAQKEKLSENSHKGTLLIPLHYAMDLLTGEYKELLQEFTTIDRNIEAIRSEAADVANFAGMIILACNRKMGGDV